VIAEILLAAIAQPDAQDLRYFLSLRFAQSFIEGQGFLAFAPAGPVVVGIP
jgi:hypothetical protein